MSSVTAVLLMTDLTDGGDAEEGRFLDAINTFFDDTPGLCALTAHTGGTKHPQALIFGGGMNYLNEAEFLAFLRAFPWEEHGCRWAQVAMQGEHDAGFGLVDAYRAPGVDAPWSEATAT